MAEYISREELIKALETDYNRSWRSKPLVVNGIDRRKVNSAASDSELAELLGL